MAEANILIVEDDELVARGLADILQAVGYHVSWRDSAAGALELLRRQQQELVFLDVNLGEESGYEVCRQLRAFSDVPVLFLTAYNSEMDVVRGFQAGGDDYVAKPFRVQELLVRVQALLRRGRQRARLSSGDLVYDVERQGMFRLGQPLELTPIEFKLVLTFLQNWPYTIERKTLLYEVWDRGDSFVEENTLNVNVSRLREKLGTFQGTAYIETVRGVGYRWAVPVQK